MLTVTCHWLSAILIIDSWGQYRVDPKLPLFKSLITWVTFDYPGDLINSVQHQPKSAGLKDTGTASNLLRVVKTCQKDHEAAPALAMTTN